MDSMHLPQSGTISGSLLKEEIERAQRARLRQRASAEITFVT